jgi:hypothetical protein
MAGRGRGSGAGDGERGLTGIVLYVVGSAVMVERNVEEVSGLGVFDCIAHVFQPHCPRHPKHLVSRDKWRRA